MAAVPPTEVRRGDVEEALRDSEALYQSLVRHLPLCVLRKNLDGIYTFVNDRFLEFSGKSRDAILGKTDFDLFPPEMAQKYRDGDNQVLRTGKMFEDLESYAQSEGEVRYIQVLKTPVHDARERIVGTQIMFWDVTSRHLAERLLERSNQQLAERNAELVRSQEELRRQTEILESVLRSIADGVVVADERGKFLVWNPAAERIIGSGPTDGPAETWTSVYGIFRPDRATAYPPSELPLARAIRGEEVSDVELFIRNEQKPAGVYVSVNGTPLSGEEGRIGGGVVVFRDITQQKLSEEALRHSEEHARQIVETAYDPFVSIDAEGLVIDWNRQSEQTFGWQRAEALGRPLVELIIPHRYRDAHTQGILRYLETGEGPVLNSRIEIMALHRDGREFPVELTVWPVHRDSSVQFHEFVHDVADRKRAEEEIRSKNQDLETLLYVISHDLREPLRAIQNFSSMVCDRYAAQLDAKGQDFLQRVVRGAQRLDRLLEDVLTLSRVQRTAQPTEEVSPGEIVADVLRQLEPRIRETGAAVRVCEPLPQVSADRRWATQAIYNLISNALKYVPEGATPDVEIAGYVGPEGTGLVVRDRGLGVPPEHAERIFQLFQRAVGRNIEGTGAGLAIVRRVAERHGGKAWVAPREGGGSEFYLTFGTSQSA
jgi:two-component system, sensor histidine kinase and response regulator